MQRTNQRTVLIADDDEGIVALLCALCDDRGYLTVAAVDGQDAVEKAFNSPPDLIVLDGNMPRKDGFQATRELKANPLTAHVPVIMLTGMQTRDDRLRGISAGANDFLAKPVDGEDFLLRVANNLKIKEYHDFLQDHADLLEEQVRERTEGIRAALERLELANAAVTKGYVETIYRLAVVSEYKDEGTGAHIKRIGVFAKELALLLGEGEGFAEAISHASMMHDIGKVGIPDRVMLKAGPLDATEWAIMKGHAETGAKVLRGSSSPYLIMAELIARSHHERWDGGGYPSGLAGEAIPLAARITNIVDQYDALRTKRSYKEALSHEAAMAIIAEGDGRTLPSHFDPRVLAAFKAGGARFEALYDRWSEEAPHE
jgi:putative two-component system response regulator